MQSHSVRHRREQQRCDTDGQARSERAPGTGTIGIGRPGTHERRDGHRVEQGDAQAEHQRSRGREWQRTSTPEQHEATQRQRAAEPDDHRPVGHPTRDRRTQCPGERHAQDEGGAPQDRHVRPEPIPRSERGRDPEQDAELGADGEEDVQPPGPERPVEPPPSIATRRRAASCGRVGHAPDQGQQEQQQDHRPGVAHPPADPQCKRGPDGQRSHRGGVAADRVLLRDEGGRPAGMEHPDDHWCQLDEHRTRAAEQGCTEQCDRPARAAHEQGAGGNPDHGCPECRLPPRSAHRGPAHHADDHEPHGEQRWQQGDLAATDPELVLDRGEDGPDAVQEVGEATGDREQDPCQAVPWSHSLVVDVHGTIVLQKVDDGWRRGSGHTG